MEEIWKDIPGWENWYQVSTLGRIRSCDRIIYCEDGQLHFVHGKLLSLSIRGLYPEVRLYRECRSKTRYVHRLVAETFLENKENLPEVNHLNGIKDDNRLENLKWCSQSENIKHSYDFLGHKKIRLFGKDNVNSRPVLMFSKDNIFIKEYSSLADAARENKLWNQNISKACLGKIKSTGGYIWKHK